MPTDNNLLKTIEYTIPNNLKQKISSYLTTLDPKILINQIKLASFLIDNLPNDIILSCSNIGVDKKNSFSLIIINNLFDSISIDHGLLLHESLSSYICRIKDISYTYEKHKYISKI